MVPTSTSDSFRIAPCPITSMPRRPALPMSCVSSPVVRVEKLTPSNLVKDETTTPRAGMLMPNDSVSVANTTLISPRWNSSSTISLW